MGNNVRIAVNSRFLTQQVTGVQRYGIELARELKRIDSSIEFICPEKVVHHELKRELNAKVLGRFSGHLWEQIDLPLYLKSVGSPLLVNLANSAPMLYGNNVVSVHDVAFERFPESFSVKFRFYYRFMIPRVLKSSKAVVTVSEFSRNELVERYGLNHEKISVVYNAVNEQFRQKTTISDELYVLAVSSLNYQKNFHSLIKAFNLLEDKNVKLYLVGGFNKSFADVTLIDDIKKNKNIVFKGRVDDDELIMLYSNALCFVFPSFYEGFGIPPLEAQSCGCPVIVSNVASIPEICGESVVYCDPYNVDDIADKISGVLRDQKLRNDMVKMGYENVSRFSWKRSAEKIYSIIRAVQSYSFRENVILNNI